MRVISISEKRLYPLTQMGVTIDDLTPGGVGNTNLHFVVMSDEQFSAMQQLLGDSVPDIEDITPKMLSKEPNEASGFLYCKGGKIPNGTKIRAYYLSQEYEAEVRGGKIRLGLKSFDNPSSAARSITRSQVNGWDFWEYLETETETWHSLDKLRHRS